MTPEQMKTLKTGDIVRGKLFGQAYIVSANYGSEVVLVQTALLTNPAEWDVIDPTTNEPRT